MADNDARKTIHATPFEWIDPKDIPPREWLFYPYYIRQFSSLTVSPGGIGKSSLLIAEALSMVTGYSLLGTAPAGPLRVWYWNGEDPKEELDRRFAAAIKHYGLQREDVEDRLFIDNGRMMPIVVAEDTRSGLKIARPVIDEVTATIRNNRIDVLIIDPFVSCHRVSENDNSAIERVFRSWATISEETNSANHLAHHTRKTMNGGSCC